MTSEIRANTIKNRVGLGTIEYSNTGPVISGVTTALNFKTGTSNLHSTGLNIFDLDVDGHTNLDNVSIAGVTTMSGNLTISNTDPRIIFVDTNNNPDFTLHANGGVMQVENSGSGTQVKLESSGSTRLFGNVIANKDLDVDGHTNLDNASVVGITTFSKSGSALRLNDGSILRIGNADDDYFLHYDNGGNTAYLSVGTSRALRITTDDFRVFGSGNSEQIIRAQKNSAVQLFYDNSLKFQTHNAGVLVSGNVYANDNNKFIAGTHNDLSIYHSGTHNYINSSNGNIELRHTVGGANEAMLKALPNGAIELYHDSSIRLKTYADGVKISSDGSTGRIVFTDESGNFAWQLTGFDSASSTGGRGVFQDANGGVVLDMRASGGNIFCYNTLKLNSNASADNLKLVLGAGSDFELFHDGNYNVLKGIGAHSTQFWTNNTARWRIQATGHLMPESDGVYSVGTSSYRLGNVYTNYMSGIINVASTQTISEFRNQHSTYGGGVRFKSNNTYGTIEIMRYDGAYGAGFYNSTGGWHWDSNMQFHGNVLPWTNNAHDLGTSSKRWRNLYINDLQLSNESKKDTGGNDVDGTWGDWTLQEGESDVYMINNRSGKKFKIKMEEVD